MTGGASPGGPLMPLDDADAVVIKTAGQVMPAQQPPEGDWATWLMLAGRGFGKTRTGAAWIDGLANTHHGCRIALVGATHLDARSVMVEGESGLLALGGGIDFQPGRRRLYWPATGSVAMLYSAEEPGTLRGPSFDYAWGDEAARWGANGPAVLANLRMALRAGVQPRLLLTTTPLPLAWLKALTEAGGVAVSRGRTADNVAHLPERFLPDLMRDYGGTRLGRQELDGEFIEDREGALWTRALLEGCRVAAPPPPLLRVVVAVDPPAGIGSHVDACGIVVAGLGGDGIAYVVADHSVQGLSPNGWATRVAFVADAHAADLVVAEANNGGEMVAEVLRGVDRELNVRLVRASVGKVARAEPVAAHYEGGRVRHVGPLPALEDELCGLGAAGAWAGPGRSPDRADALVWAIFELLIRKQGRGGPGVRML